LTDKQ